MRSWWREWSFLRGGCWGGVICKLDFVLVMDGVKEGASNEINGLIWGSIK